MKSLIKVGLLLVVGVLTYNYFYGTDEEKATSQKVFNQVKEVGKTVGELVKSERQKFADGKYDDAFDKLDDLYKSAKETLSNAADRDNLDREDSQALEDLERRKRKLIKEKEKLEKELAEEDVSEETVEESQTLEKELNELLDESKVFLRKILKEK